MNYTLLIKLSVATIGGGGRGGRGVGAEAA